MSSILKALKKIENESVPDNGVQLNGQMVVPRDTINTQVKRTVRLYQISILCTILVMSVGIWIALTFQPFSDNYVLHSDMNMPTAVDTVGVDPVVSSKKTDEVHLEAAAAENKHIPLTANLPLPEKSDEIKPEKVIDIKTDPGREISVEQHATVSEIKPQPEIIHDDVTVKLQAISWSADSTHSMAVINNRIVREGDSVDGLNIIRIDKDHVVINTGNGEEYLGFSLN